MVTFLLTVTGDCSCLVVVVGNLGALVIQSTFIHGCKTEKYLIVSLSLADFLMGLYLLAIASVDLMYNMIFYKIASEWTNSITCAVFGLMHYISSEVALLILTTMAFARMISIEKVGGMAIMKSQIRTACVSARVVVVLCGIAYIVYLLTQNMGVHLAWDFTSKICHLFGACIPDYVYKC